MWPSLLEYSDTIYSDFKNYGSEYVEETRVGSEMLEPIDDIKLEANVKLNNKAQFSSVTGTINY